MLDAKGRIVAERSVPLRSAAYGVTDDCRWLAIGRPTQGTSVTRVGWLRVDDGSFYAISDVTATERQTITFAGQRVAATVPFASGPLVTAGGARVVVATSSKPELRVYDTCGLRTIVRWDTRVAKLTPEVRHAYAVDRGHLTAVAGAGATDQIPELKQFHLPKDLPVFVETMLDAGSRIWVRQASSQWVGFERAYGPVMMDEPAYWWVFADDGTALGTVTTPPHFSVSAIGTDWMTGALFRDGRLRLYTTRFRFPASNGLDPTAATMPSNPSRTP
jgi:hypothetical protein